MENLTRALAQDFKRYYWKVFLFCLLSAFWFSLVRTLSFPTLAQNEAQQIKEVQVKPQEDVAPKLAVNKKFELTKSDVTKTAKQEFDQARAYVVINIDTGQVLLEKNSSQALPFASITKVMSAMVTLDLADPSEAFTVSEHAAGIEPTKIGVVPGEKMQVSELLAAAILTSANDAVEVLKEGIDEKYGAGTFVKAMNKKAQELGLESTHFTNPQGFHNDNHYSSAEDIAKFSAYALANYPLIAELAKKDYSLLPENNNHKIFDLYNWNGLLGVYPGSFGLKIGYTPEAGFTTVVAAERDGKRLLTVLLGAPKTQQRDLWTASLMDEAYAMYHLPKANISLTQLEEKYATWKYWN